METIYRSFYSKKFLRADFHLEFFLKELNHVEILEESMQ